SSRFEKNQMGETMAEKFRSTRRAFLQGATALSAGTTLFGNGAARAAAAGARRQVSVGGKRIKTVDVHAHCAVDITAITKGTPLEKAAAGLLATGGLQSSLAIGPDRIKVMDEEGIDVQALTINAFWYGADRDLATKLIDAQNALLAEIPKAYPGRFVSMASV